MQAAEAQQRKAANAALSPAGGAREQVTALHAAASLGNAELVQVLIRARPFPQ
jgi:hypothetical protein